MSSYKVTVGNATVRVKTLKEAGLVVMEAVTNFLAEDPDGAAGGAMMANREFNGEEVQHELDAGREWRTIVMVHGEEVPIVIKKRHLW